MRRTLIAFVATITASLGLASAAQAHHGSITADCTGVTFSMASFHYPTTINYTITRVPGGTVTGSFPISTSSLVHKVPLVSHGTVTITASASWTGKETGSIRPTTVTVRCTEAPVVTPAPAAPTPTPATPVPSVPVPTNVPVTAPRPVSGGTGSPERRRFGTTRTKRCVNGRRVLKDSRGKRFTKCRKAPKPRFAGQRGPTPRFTG